MAHQLTKKDIEKMEAEIDKRKHVDRPYLIEKVKEARAQGDLSENFEYYAAKREKNKNESRIRYLEKMIKQSEIIEDNAGACEVGIGDDVTVVFEEDGFEDTYTLVTTMSADSLANNISIESPIGSAIRGKRVGDRVLVVTENKTEFYISIVKIEKSNRDIDIVSY